MSDKQSRTEKLKIEIEIKDKLIGLIIRELAQREITLPDYIVVPLEQLYNNKIKKMGIN